MKNAAKIFSVICLALLASLLLTAQAGLWTPISKGGTGASLADPNADRIFFWDDSKGGGEWLSLPTGLGFSGTSIILADDLAALEAQSGTGLVTRTGTATYAQRTITGTANEITVTNGDGVSADPTIDLPNTISVATAIELSHATANTLAASGGHMTIEAATVWDSGNDGTGSGLDADLLDGKNIGTSGNVVGLLDGNNVYSGTSAFSGAVDIQKALAWTGDVSPSQIVANVNDYAPTDFATNTILRINSDAARDITGLAGGSDGLVKTFCNVGAFTITLKEQNVSSSVANRFAMGGDYQLGPEGCQGLIYDSTSSRWRRNSTTSAGAGVGTVTSVATGDGLTGGPITASGTVSGDPSFLPGFLFGLTLSNGTDATNDINIAVGLAVDSTNAKYLKLPSIITKQLDAAWAVGTNAGGLDTGAIANTTYHVWLIKRSDTGVVDALFSTSATAPTMPANYDYKRRIGSILRESATIIPFSQVGDEFLRKASILDVTAANPGTSAVTRTLSVPTGIVVWAKLNTSATSSDVTNAAFYSLSSLDRNDEAPATAAAPLMTSPRLLAAAAGTQYGGSQMQVRTNTSGQIRSRFAGTTTSVTLYIATIGWIDRRGRDG